MLVISQELSSAGRLDPLKTTFGTKAAGPEAPLTRSPLDTLEMSAAWFAEAVWLVMMLGVAITYQTFPVKVFAMIHWYVPLMSVGMAFPAAYAWFMNGIADMGFFHS